MGGVLRRIEGPRGEASAEAKIVFREGIRRRGGEMGVHVLVLHGVFG